MILGNVGFRGVGKWILRLMQGYFPKDVSEKSPTKAAGMCFMRF